MGAAVGNNNAAKGRDWRDALNWALENFENKSVKRGMALRHIAMNTVKQAIDGDKDARTEIANRKDGKPVQPLSGDQDNPLELNIHVRFGE